MSGGHFNYDQYRIDNIIYNIEQLIETNDDESLDDWGYRNGRGYPPEIIDKFKEAIHTLKRGREMAQRVDWLVSGDDGEESFLRRWEEEVPD